MMAKTTRAKASSQRVDVAILGAGVAGLTCARELQAAGLSIRVLEARSRVGGRIFTRRHPEWEYPAELGAEFVHGAPDVLLERLGAGAIGFVDASDEHLTRVGKELRDDADYFEELERTMKKLRQLRGRDLSIREVIDGAGRRWNAELRSLFAAFVEGFHAADLSLMSLRGLTESEQAEEADLNGVSSFRFPEGYDRLSELLRHALADANENLLFEHIVNEIRWARGEATLKIKSSLGDELPDMRARAVVVTAPLGVLKAPPEAKAAIKFSPEPAAFARAKNAMHMGHAMRLILRFRSRFWEDLSDKPISYLHTGPGRDFPTWWTLSPLRAPMLVGWQGGPRAAELAACAPEEQVRRALETLSSLTLKPLSFLRRELRGWDTHDWTHDPFSLGAYSFIGVGGVEAARALARPVQGTLFFAGEHTFSGAERGTVSGAMKTGLRAARQVRQALEKEAR